MTSPFRSTSDPSSRVGSSCSCAKLGLDPDNSKSAEWNRGRYLVDGLGHCGACHTPRNILGAEKKNSAFAGGAAGGWHAPPLNADTVAAEPWTVDQLAEYLSTGWHRLHGAAGRPHDGGDPQSRPASPEDVRAIAAYIASPFARVWKPKGGHAAKAGKFRRKCSLGSRAIYVGASPSCHNDRNDVGPSKALSLSLSSAVRGPDRRIRCASSSTAYRRLWRRQARTCRPLAASSPISN